MKRGARTVLAVMLLLAAVFLWCGNAPKVAKALLPNTPVYAEPSVESEIVLTLPQNDMVTAMEEVTDEKGDAWTRVVYQEKYYGYIRSDRLYYSVNGVLSSETVRITPSRMGEAVPLYLTVGGEAVLTLPDATSVSRLTTEADYGKYALVEYEGKRYFVLSENLTDGLTLNQKAAVWILAVLSASGIVAVVTLCIYRKMKKNK